MQNLMVDLLSFDSRVLGSSLVWGLLAVFTAQTDLADQPTVAHGKDLPASGMEKLDLTKMQGMYKEMSSQTSGGELILS